MINKLDVMTKKWVFQSVLESFCVSSIAAREKLGEKGGEIPKLSIRIMVFPDSIT